MSSRDWPDQTVTPHQIKRGPRSIWQLNCFERPATITGETQKCLVDESAGPSHKPVKFWFLTPIESIQFWWKKNPFQGFICGPDKNKFEQSWFTKWFEPTEKQDLLFYTFKSKILKSRMTCTIRIGLNLCTSAWKSIQSGENQYEQKDQFCWSIEFQISVWRMIRFHLFSMIKFNGR